MPAIIVATITATKKKPGCQNKETIFEIIIFAFD